MRSLQTHSVYSVLALATGLCLAACSKDEKTSLLVDVTLDKLVAGPPDQVTFAVSRGQTKFTNQQTDWSAASAGTLKVTLLLPAKRPGLSPWT